MTQESAKKSLPLFLIIGIVGVGGAMYMFVSGPNESEMAAAKLANSGSFGGVLGGQRSGEGGSQNGEDEEDGMLPGRINRAQQGRMASSQFADTNYGQSSLSLVGGKLSIDEAIDLEGGKKPLPEGSESSVGNIPGADGILGKSQGNASLFGQGEVGGFDKKSSKLDETADYYGKQMSAGGEGGGSASGKGNSGKDPLTARNANASTSGSNTSAAKGGVARSQRAGVQKRGVEGQQANNQNAFNTLVGNANFAVGAITGNSNFQVAAGALGQAMSGSANTGILSGVQSTDPAGISANDLPSTNDPTAPHNESQSQKLFDWNPRPEKLKYTDRDWSALGDYSESYAEAMGMGDILAQFIGFPGKVTGFLKGADSSNFFNYFSCGRRRCGCHETYTSYVSVTVPLDGGKEKTVTSRASPFTATCDHHRKGCHGAGSVDMVDTIPFGEGRFLLIYNYFQRHAQPNPGVTGYLLNLPNVKADREPMFVPINASASRSYNLGPCLRHLASEYADKCGVGTITSYGLMDKLLGMNVPEENGGVRGACVQHYELPRKFQECVNTNSGDWGM